MKLLLQNYIQSLWFELVLREVFSLLVYRYPRFLQYVYILGCSSIQKFLETPIKTILGVNLLVHLILFFDRSELICAHFHVFLVKNHLKSSSFVQSLPWTFHWLHLQHFLIPLWGSMPMQKQCSPLPDGSWLQSFCMFWSRLIS